MNTRPEKRWDVRGFFSTKHVKDGVEPSAGHKKRTATAGSLALAPLTNLAVPDNAIARNADGSFLPRDFLDAYRVSSTPGGGVEYRHIDGSTLPEGVTVKHFHPFDMDDDGKPKEGAREYDGFNPLTGLPSDWGA